jgi:hypothetical protein
MVKLSVLWLTSAGGEVMTNIEDRRDYGTFIPSFLDDFRLDMASFRLYAHIARRAGSGTCWESIDSMAEICQMNRKTAYKSFRILQDQKLILVEKRKGQTNLITLTHHSIWLPIPNKVQPQPIPNQVQPCTKSGIPPVPNQVYQPVPNQVHKGTPSEVTPIKSDRSDDFSDISDLAKNLEISSDKAIATLQANLGAEKCDLNPDQDSELTNTPEEMANPSNGDLSRRALEDFIISFLKIEISDEKRPTYFKRFKPEDWDKWQAKYKAANRPPVKIEQRDPVAEDPWRVENAIASMVRCKDFDAAKDRLSLVEKTNPILAKQLREKYLCS